MVLARGNNDPVVAKTKVATLVQALPGYGTVRAATVLAQANIVENRRVGGLGDKQRDALIAVLELTASRQ